MRLYQLLLTKNDCYKAGRKLKPKGVMVHSTGANNPNLGRYVGPDDGRLGSGANHWNAPGISKCVHAFIGKLADGTVATYQTLPWTMRGWHGASGPKGSVNDTHIGFEICEDDLSNKAYFRSVYREAVDLTAWLCRTYHLDPLADGVVICHAEGYQRGIASKHGDVLHWFSKHKKTMDDFRADVARAMLDGEEVDDVDEERVRAIVREELKAIERERGQRPASDWAVKELERAKAAGITDGTRPQGFATREEVASMIERRFLTAT